jgi:FAD/FMN-containing dehydrogenase
VPTADARFVRALADVVGDAHVATDPEITRGYCVDWTGRYVGASPAVVRPSSTAEVAAVIGICREHGVAVVAQGGNTGLVGGGVPLVGELVLSLTRMASVANVDLVAGQVTAQAGSTIAQVQAAAGASSSGLTYAVDLASRASATVGGTIATNAGGLRVVRFGDTRAQLLGIEAVLGDGSVVSHLGGLPRDNTGYDLAGLLAGSEGTLGIVTAARLRLVPVQPFRTTALLGFTSAFTAIDAVVGLRRTAPSIEALELFFRSGLELVCEMAGLQPPLASLPDAYLLVESSGPADPTDELSSAVSALVGVTDAAVTSDGPRRRALWQYRELHTEAISRVGIPHKLDVAIPLRALADFLVEVPHVVASVAPEARVFLFGHAADGNVHVNITGIPVDDLAVDDAVLRSVAERGGSISAEHGIGSAKRKWLHLNRSAAELAAMIAIKRALDPDGILNPNVLLSPVVPRGTVAPRGW